jgi:hypothetical protein
MLNVTNLIGFGVKRGGGAVTSGLQLYLDVGNSASYSGSGQNFNDLSGNGRNFYLGAGSGSEGSDPTYNAGPPAYFSVDGGDYFSDNYTTTGDFLRAVGRTDTAFTLEIWARLVAGGASNYYLWANGNSSDGGNRGSVFHAGPSGTIRLSSGAAEDIGPTISDGSWAQYVLAAQLNGSASCQWYKNGAASGSSFTRNNSGFTSGDSAGEPFLLATGGSFPAYTGTRYAIFRAYNRILTAGEVLQNYNADKGTFGL